MSLFVLLLLLLVFTNQNTTVWRRGIRTHATEQNPFAYNSLTRSDSNSCNRKKSLRLTTVWRRRFEHTQQQNPFAYNSLTTKIRTRSNKNSFALQQFGHKEPNSAHKNSIVPLNKFEDELRIQTRRKKEKTLRS